MLLKPAIKKVLPQKALRGYHYLLAFLGSLIFAQPSKGLTVIGVTGTNGKSTTVKMISQILEEAGFKTAYTSSIEFKIGRSVWQNRFKMTMPGRFFLQSFLRKAKKAGCQYVIIEVTSEGIKLFRHKFIDFDIALITNLRPEHIESHGNYENYKKAKGELFKSTKKIHIINLDEKESEYFLSFSAQEKWGYGINFDSAKHREKIKILQARDVQVQNQGVEFLVKGEKIKLSLKGKFNIYNALAAICVGLSQGIDIKTIKRGLEKIEKVSGRLEEIISAPFRVYVDYAHTPDALEEVYATLKKELSQRGKLICVLGSCGGGRDKWKRPLMGKIAEKYCDKIILTNEDPYDEDPKDIIEDITKGIKKKDRVVKILERKKAILEAIKEAKLNDIVIITGKGSEPWMCVKGNKKIPWDDREIVKEAFQALSQTYGEI
ncbi:UDP-N-acetylmuramoyl-L-alanyl-D-glutamate--2,6-diaminopimelate ligase [bacterium]|nr:UDP-N-acetylmuramoyl-L-alanyl-D-glutamate--2,6-diaminopimelate ligase [bacterium]